MAACASCHDSCATCEWAADPMECLTCVAAHATSTDPLGGFCYCDPGYEDRESPTLDCQVCSGCSHCAGGDALSCMSEEQAAFNRIAVALHGLPTASETSGDICYRTPVADNDCTLTAVEIATDSIRTATPGVLSPSVIQCHQLLLAQWGTITYWFNRLFPDFSPPALTTERSYLVVKTILQLWIIQFSSDRMVNDPLWQGVVAVFNLPTAQWQLIRATGANYYNGENTLNYPQELAAWITQHPEDLAAFNTFTA